MDRLRPTIPTFTPGTPGSLFTPGGYHSFEHRWALADAFDFQRGLGPEQVAERVTTLATRLKDGLAHMRRSTRGWARRCTSTSATSMRRWSAWPGCRSSLRCTDV
jgi:hypothetical protein